MVAPTHEQEAGGTTHGKRLSATVLPADCSAFFITFLLFRLSGLSREELVSATIIEDSTFIENMLKNIDTHSSQLGHLPSSRSIRLPFQEAKDAPFDLLSNFRIALTSENLMYLEGKEITIVKLMKWLD